MTSIGNFASLDRVRECLNVEVRSKEVVADSRSRFCTEIWRIRRTFENSQLQMALRAACPGATTPAAGLAALSTSRTSAIHSKQGVPVTRKSTRDGANCVCELSESNESVDSKRVSSGLVEFQLLIAFLEVNCVVEPWRVLV